MLFVASAMFEYAMLLAIRFVIGNTNQRKLDKRCSKIDRNAMMTFIGAYALTVGTYFYVVLSNKTSAIQDLK